MQELIMQISVNCFERGSMLDHVWGTYLKLFDRII